MHARVGVSFCLEACTRVGTSYPRQFTYLHECVWISSKFWNGLGKQQTQPTSHADLSCKKKSLFLSRMYRAGSFTKSVSAFVVNKNQSPTYQGYDRFICTASVPRELPNIPTKAPHMQDYSYVVDHAAKPDIDNKSI
jgi:hypothetical protein